MTQGSHRINHKITQNQSQNHTESHRITQDQYQEELVPILLPWSSCGCVREAFTGQIIESDCL